ncbi:hypothetical protein I3842_03G122800 [Carya illinoinensis]|uniref:Uncharacterized protein n=1 Tax=Carya illinoinensis TaxID=32201 RepID=A0A922FK02_CARIL|nr:hypothetical protein I3842_03G122800 [Carya illinoinensis]
MQAPLKYKHHSDISNTHMQNRKQKIQPCSRPNIRTALAEKSSAHADAESIRTNQKQMHMQMQKVFGSHDSTCRKIDAEHMDSNSHLQQHMYSSRNIFQHMQKMQAAAKKSHGIAGPKASSCYF